MNDEYLDQVSAYLRSPDNENLKDILFSPDNIQLTYDALVHLKRDVERQLSYQHSTNIQKKMECMRDKQQGLAKWQEHQLQYADWKAKVIRFLVAIEQALSTTKAVKRNANDDRDERMQMILDRIRDHKETISEDQGSEADQELWAVLNG